MLKSDHTLDRAALRHLIFNDPAARARLEAILHPAIRLLAHQRATAAAAQSPYVVVVIALLAEPQVQPHYTWLNRVIGVRTTSVLQRERLQQRPGINAELASQMLIAQCTDEQRMALVDDWLENTGDILQLEAQVQQLHERLLAQANKLS